MRPTLLLAILLIGCGDDTHPGDAAGDTDVAPDTADTADTSVPSDTAPDTEPPPATFCEGATRFEWDPDNGDFLAAFPDDALSVDDPTTLTGLRVHVGDPAWLATQPAFFQSAWHQLDELDGFGLSAGVVLRFSAPVATPPSGSTSVDSDAILLLDLGTTPPTRVPFETQVLDEGATLVLWPMRPLRETTLHAALVTTALADAGGACIGPSSPLQAALTGAPGGTAVARLQPRFAQLVSGVAAFDIAPGDISAATVFTTQAFSAATLAQRAHLDAHDYAWKPPPTCTGGDPKLLLCEGSFFAFDYRIVGYLGAALDPANAPDTYQLPVHVWLPKARTGPVPLLVFGHGLGGDAEQAELIAELAADNGIATLAIASPHHGDHPTATSSDPQAIFTGFFGIDLGQFSINGFIFRENVRQAAFDKLQMMRLIARHPDIDGDGAADLDLGKVAYWGISLGGILGPNFVAQSQHVSAAIFSVPGARLISIVSEAEDFKALFDLLANLSGGRDELLRQLPAAQTLIDAGDPVSWAPHMLADPAISIGRPGVPRPHVLLQMVLNDSTVPNVATRSLVRALGVPLVPKVIVPIDLVPEEPSAPVSDNLDGVTGGLFEFDRVSQSPGGRPVVATHGGVFSGLEAIDQVAVFLESWLASPDATPTIVDPYAENGTPPLD